MTRGIAWTPLRYHKRPPVLSTAYDVCRGIVAGLYLACSGRFKLVHARSYVAALIALTLSKMLGGKFLFDLRGFWADEKVDGGHWSATSVMYRLAKRWERRFFESADGIVSLTKSGVAAFSSLGYGVRRGTPIEVIPTCTDLERFSPGPKDPHLVSRLGLGGHFVIGYTGTMSNWYLRGPILDGLAYLAAHLGQAKVLIVTRENHERLREDACRAGLQQHQMVLVQAPFEAMPEYLRLMDLGLFFIKPCFSKKGSSATKLGEFLATGVPVIINDGIGDSGEIVRTHDVGLVLQTAGAVELQASLKEIKRIVNDPLVSRRCRAAAEQHFDLRVGADKYAALYDMLLGVTASHIHPSAEMHRAGRG